MIHDTRETHEKCICKEEQWSHVVIIYNTDWRKQEIYCTVQLKNLSDSIPKNSAL